MSDALVRAAGGLVSRAGESGVEVLVVHRPRYDDWSIPKGKVEPGESDEDAARREVEEETGYQCTLSDELTTIRYIDRKGRNKQVRFWKMTVIGEIEWAPNDEVDVRRWISPSVAAKLLTYETDRALLKALR
jgi:8-oxo-dGTP diphosphatase